jgi:hypothetical protein
MSIVCPTNLVTLNAGNLHHTPKKIPQTLAYNHDQANQNCAGKMSLIFWKNEKGNRVKAKVELIR